MNADGTESIFALTMLEKIKGTRLKFLRRSVTVLKIIANYQEARDKLTNAQVNKVKSAVTD